MTKEQKSSTCGVLEASAKTQPKPGKPLKVLVFSHALY